MVGRERKRSETETDRQRHRERQRVREDREKEMAERREDKRVQVRERSRARRGERKGRICESECGFRSFGSEESGGSYLSNLPPFFIPSRTFIPHTHTHTHVHYPFFTHYEKKVSDNLNLVSVSGLS